MKNLSFNEKIWVVFLSFLFFKMDQKIKSLAGDRKAGDAINLRERFSLAFATIWMLKKEKKENENKILFSNVTPDSFFQKKFRNQIYNDFCSVFFEKESIVTVSCSSEKENSNSLVKVQDGYKTTMLLSGQGLLSEDQDFLDFFIQEIGKNFKNAEKFFQKKLEQK